MYWDVKTVKPMSDYRIYVEVEDGRKGIFDVKPYLDHGVFRELKECTTSTKSGYCLAQ
jgi:hypothetical protein